MYFNSREYNFTKHFIKNWKHPNWHVLLDIDILVRKAIQFLIQHNFSKMA